LTKTYRCFSLPKKQTLFQKNLPKTFHHSFPQKQMLFRRWTPLTKVHLSQNRPSYRRRGLTSVKPFHRNAFS
jgi:hypothetical protein